MKGGVKGGKRSFHSKKGRFTPNVWTDWTDSVTVRKIKERRYGKWFMIQMAFGNGLNVCSEAADGNIGSGTRFYPGIKPVVKMIHKRR